MTQKRSPARRRLPEITRRHAWMRRAFAGATIVLALAVLAGPALAQAQDPDWREPPPADDPPEEVAEAPAGPTLSLGRDADLFLSGMIRGDVNWDDSAFDNARLPMFVRSEDATATNFIGRNHGQLSAHTRLTRLSADLVGRQLSALGDADVTARLAFDFFSVPASEARPELSLDEAWVQLSWTSKDAGTLWVKAGHMWDLVSPLRPSVNQDSYLWDAGNLGDRRIQGRVEYQVPLAGSILEAQIGLGLSGNVSGQDLDGDGIVDGEASGKPNLQGRLAYHLPIKDQELVIGVWGWFAWEELNATAINGATKFQSRGFGIDFVLPVYEDVFWLRGELWIGDNLNDLRGGNGQGINTTTGEQIDARGLWAEFGLRPVQWYEIGGGLSSDDPDNNDVPAGGRARTTVYFLFQRLSFGQLTIGLEWQNWNTDYRGFGDGTANRIKLWLAYAF